MSIELIYQLISSAVLRTANFFTKIGASGSWAEPNFARRLQRKRGIKHSPGMLGLVDSLFE